MLSVRRGDERAFAELVRRYQGRVVSLAYRYLGSAADTEDLAQEVFLRVHRARESYEPSARFSTWIYRITANASLNFLRARKTRKAIRGEMPAARDAEDGGADPALDPEDPSQEDPAAGVEKAELARVMRAAVDALPERQRIAILLNKYEGLSYEEVAAAMEMSEMAVKSLLTRARVALKERLAPYLETGVLPPEPNR